MTVREAIVVAQEEEKRYLIAAEEMTAAPLDDDGRCVEHARRYKQRAQALGMLLRIAQEWERTASE